MVTFADTGLAGQTILGFDKASGSELIYRTQLSIVEEGPEIRSR